ncbi:hypothetical protein [Candidatus Velamenicoccus archaeovorus]|uniref:hypothetical protein n=1 Tax=Velamenicoccus archaeovorus TaxID=1930593 RepID=UPI000FFF231D|nr:hypothetical protein [Candidatus Velamenicoccus archaeovorus]
MYRISVGMESKFNLFSPFWFYRSRYEEWFIVRIFGIYYWFHEKKKSGAKAPDAFKAMQKKAI